VDRNISYGQMLRSGDTVGPLTALNMNSSRMMCLHIGNTLTKKEYLLVLIYRCRYAQFSILKTCCLQPEVMNEM
jgi:hypothetical protein